MAVWYPSRVSSSQPTAPQQATYADIEALPPHVVGEILAGALVVSPRPAGPHAVAASALGGLLNVAFQQGILGPGGWWILMEPELSLGVDPAYDPVVPDCAGWRLESHPGKPMGAQMHVTPDWVCEVLSPGTARRDRMLKVPFYARAGVRHCWLVDPLAETVEVLRLSGGGSARAEWVLAGVFGGDQTAAMEPFAALEIDLPRIWGRTPPG